MKKKNLNSVLNLKKSIVVNLNQTKAILGGTGESCVDICETRNNLICSYDRE